MKKAPATGQGLGRTGMNNVNIDFNFKYPGKKERVIYTVTVSYTHLRAHET